jgi:hypothetical protein
VTRLAPLFLAAALLAGCSEYRATAPAPPGPAGPATARFAPDDVNLIQVTVTDRLPARIVELVAPDGGVQPARSIEAARATAGLSGRGGGQTGPAIGTGLGGFGGNSSGFGLGIGAPLGQPTETASGSDIVSNAFIPLPDPLQYRLTWRSWRIRVRLGDPPGETRSFELPAPQPPD